MAVFREIFSAITSGERKGHEDPSDIHPQWLPCCAPQRAIAGKELGKCRSFRLCCIDKDFLANQSLLLSLQIYTQPVFIDLGGKGLAIDPQDPSRLMASAFGPAQDEFDVSLLHIFQRLVTVAVL